VNPLWPSLRRIVADLSTEGVRFALVGGLAASSRAEPRFTRDVDLAVLVDDDDGAEALVRRLLALGYRVTAVIEQEATGRLSTVRLVPPIDTGVVVDLLFASCGIEPEIVAAAENIALAPGLIVPVALSGHLIAMKLLSESPRRPQDRVDLVRLCQHIAPADVAIAEAAVALIESRGFARDRDLVVALQRLCRDIG